MTIDKPNHDDQHQHDKAHNPPLGRAGLAAGEAGPEGGGALLPRGRACQESQEEQTHPSQSEGHPCKGTKSIPLIISFQDFDLNILPLLPPPPAPP